MSKATEIAIPASSDRGQWTEEEAAWVEAAGLVFVHTYGDNAGQKVLAPRPVIAKFFDTARRTGLNPLARQIYCIGRFGRDGLEWSIQTAIDGFRVIAERSGHYAGMDEVEWLAEDGTTWTNVFLAAVHAPQSKHPLAARVRVYRHDWDRPMTAVATWEVYAQTKRNGELTSMWVGRGADQLAKCAEALALRRAFPHDLSGIYTDDEMRATNSIEDGSLDAEEHTPTARRSRVAQVQQKAAESVENPVEGTATPETDSVASDERVASPVADPTPAEDEDSGHPYHSVGRHVDLVPAEEDAVELKRCEMCGVDSRADDVDADPYPGLCGDCAGDVMAAEGES